LQAECHPWLSRTKRHVELTDAGRHFLKEARDIVARDASAAPMRLGGFVPPPINDPSLNSDVVISEPLVVALPCTHRLTSLTALPLSALENEPFVLPPREAVPVFHDAVLKACREAGFVPHSPHEADHLHMVLGMVAANVGVALVPDSARKFRSRSIVFRGLDPSPGNLETAIAWRREGASSLAVEFIRCAREVLSRRRPAKPLAMGRNPPHQTEHMHRAAQSS